MILLAIDPGPEKSAWLDYDTDAKQVVAAGIQENDMVLNLCDRAPKHCHYLAIEMIASYGMAVGASTFETCVWIGRFIQAFGMCDYDLAYRKDIKLHLCGSLRAKDANVRQALIDRFPATGGGKTPQVGTKKQPGPLHGIKSHLWSALAVAVYWADTHEETT